MLYDFFFKKNPRPFKIWLHANAMQVMSVIIFRMRFKATKPGPRFQTLLSNCDPKSGTEPSLEVVVDTVYHEVVFTINTYENPPKSIKIYYQVCMFLLGLISCGFDLF